jgi:hypothetical protein
MNNVAGMIPDMCFFAFVFNYSLFIIHFIFSGVKNNVVVK